jgi:mannose-6-phosphate isomerase-like protein (cupin superfamily)
MHVLKKETSPRYTRPEGITSYLLASPRTSSAEHLTTTLAVIQPGGEQRLHSHRPEQVYFILEGRGLMTVGSETQRYATSAQRLQHMSQGTWRSPGRSRAR